MSSSVNQSEFSMNPSHNDSPTNSPYIPNWVSVVVTAQSHNPSILSHEFLVKNEIVPSKWLVSEAYSSPTVSLVSYTSDIQWLLDQSRLAVNQKCQSKFQDNYDLHQCVQKYVRKLPHVSYQNLGLNCGISVKHSSPVSWLTERFLKPRSSPQSSAVTESISMIPKFILPIDDATHCHMAFAHQDANLEDDSKDSCIKIDFNIHHEGPLDVDRICKTIEQWPSYQDFITAALDDFLRVDPW